ncbi:MAG: ThuA domain-containing protein [Phaeodactylibacter sp.]|nr:ThuA domain-containing protein [Phaeodactylibacter sp.]MCB9052363.1 ThuA domain-containing protein [Lewinellaceae bacterium]
MNRHFLLAYAVLFCCSALFTQCTQPEPIIRMLVFSKTEGYRHASIEPGIEAIRKLGEQHGLTVEATEDAAYFTQENLQQYNVILFLSTTEDVFDESQQLEFQRWVQAGGGFVGIHSATNTEYDWPWYNELVGGYFASHPPGVSEAVIERVDAEHISTRHLPENWIRTDEWYNFEKLIPTTHKLLNLNEATYKGGTMGKDHPIAWYHEFDGGRAWYTALGHTAETYSEPLFLEHVWGGIQYAAGEGRPVDYSRPTVAPAENRFEKIVLTDNLFEPMELDFLPGGQIIFIERHGAVKVYDLALKRLQTVQQIRVNTTFEDGLLGLAVDPDFYSNHWLYLFYSDPEEALQRVSRFTYTDGAMPALSEEEVLLTIPTQREECCHAAGSLQFGPGRMLYIATGDNTNPFQSDGYAPIDGRPGRKPFDARRSSANTNDLRGKVLRIRVKEDGSTEIPDGNLFPKGGSGGRPEIYAMGCRNPFRISIDQRNGTLYWGDVGPDAGKPRGRRGPAGHDEVNRAPGPGFFGWPLFVGNNKPYHQYDFSTATSGEPFQAGQPVNRSPFNTGAEALPPAQPAFIWYPYGRSEEFPATGKGGRTAMAGPVFYSDQYYENDGRYPPYFEGKLFTYEWMRGWIMCVSMDENGRHQRMERFMPSHTFSNPVDLEFNSRGELFLLEYGNSWYTQNNDARLVHLRYNSGNRKPVARAACSEKYGAAPLSVRLSAEASTDYDQDLLSFEWHVNGKPISNAKTTDYTFTENGRHRVRLIVKDSRGQASTATEEVWVGNSKPQLEIKVKGNRSFYWDNEELPYQVAVEDKEDGQLGRGILPEEIVLSMDYLETGYDITQIAQGHQQQALASPGQRLIEESNCLSCHQIDKTSVGPSYLQVAERYKKESPALVEKLARKIISGGSGAWGEVAMSAHPHLSLPQTRKIVEYILSLDEPEKKGELPTAGVFAFRKHQKGNTSGMYIINATYKDRGGNGIPGLTAHQQLILRYPQFYATDYDIRSHCRRLPVDTAAFPGFEEGREIIRLDTGHYIGFRDIDLSGITFLRANLLIPLSQPAAGSIEIRVDGPSGPLIGKGQLKNRALNGQQSSILIPLKRTEGFHNLLLYFKNPEGSQQSVDINTIEFLTGSPKDT